MKGSDQVKDLLKKLLVADPKKRIEWDDFFNHPWITGNDDCSEASIMLLSIRNDNNN